MSTKNGHADKLPPHDLSAEAAVLGCCLLGGLNDAISLISSPDVFYCLKHRRIFEVLCAMAEDGSPIETITLQSRLLALKQLQAVGGNAYVSALPDKATVGNLEHYAKIILDKHQLRKLEKLCIDTSHEVLECEHPVADILDRFESRALMIRTEQGQGVSINCSQGVNRAMQRIKNYQEAPETVQGIPTGFKGVDNLLGGLQPGLMYVIAARTSRGKTAFALNIAAHAAVDLKLPVGIFSLETTEDQLLMRLLCSFAGVNSHHIRQNRLRDYEVDQLRNHAHRLRKAPLYIDPAPGLSVMRLRARARRMVQQWGIKLFVIDYLQLLSVPFIKGMTREQCVSQISNAIKVLGLELNIPIMVLAQLKREADRERKPRLEDLRESGAIEQDADAVMLLYTDLSDEEYREQDVVPVRVIVAKNKDGPCGEVQLSFRKALTRFETPDAIDGSDVPDRQTEMPIPYAD